MADSVDRNASNSRWFCHSCDSEILPDLQEYKCPVCGNGFIEAIGEEISSDEMAVDPVEGTDVGSTTPVQNNQWPPIPQPVQPGSGATAAGAPFNFRFPPPFVFRNVPHFAHANPFAGFQGFVEQLLSGLMGGINPGPGAANFNIQLGPNMFNGNLGDYVYSAEGLDNIVTMLMNQLEGAGPPPATKQFVDALPFVAVTQSQIDDQMQCHVCMENFELDERVKELPCRHIYHNDCITPWLALHGTCPVCRKRIDANVTNPNSTTFHSGQGRT